MIGGLGIWELIIILVIIIIIFGASRIKDIGKGLGEGIREFKKATKEADEKPEQIAEAKPKQIAESSKAESEPVKEADEQKESVEK